MKNNETVDGPKPATCSSDRETNDANACRSLMGRHLGKRPLANTGKERIISKWIFGKQFARMA
jgi:hypothetical protein